MGRHVRKRFLAMAWVITAAMITSAGCSRAPSATNLDPVQGEPTTSASVQTLRGIPSAQTPRLADLGDVGLLGDDTTMREALVGGDDEVVIAATMLHAADMFSVELIVLNRRDKVLQIDRSDLRVADADGNWLEPVSSWEEGDRIGLSGRRSTNETKSSPVVYEVDRERERELAHSRLLLDLGEDWGSTASKRSTKARSPLKPSNRDVVERSAQPELAATTGTPVRVKVPASDGGAFWGYFRGPAPRFPLTAVVTVEGRPIAFRFER